MIDQGLFSYLNSWAAVSFGPILLAVTLIKKKYNLSIIIFIFHIFIFGVSSHKAYLLYPFVVFFVYLFHQSSKSLVVVPILTSFIIVICFAVYIIFDDYWLTSLFINRVIFVPSLLTFKYYEFFSQNHFIYWSESITSNFISYPYDLNTARLIGDYMGRDEHANNSFLSTGYMHAGIAGMILYGILCGLLLRLIDSIRQRTAGSVCCGSDRCTLLYTHNIGRSADCFADSWYRNNHFDVIYAPIKA